MNEVLGQSVVRVYVVECPNALVVPCTFQLELA